MLLGARPVLLDAQRATKARMDGMQAWLGVPPLMGVPPLAELLGG